jgi:hypothetical protein
MNIDLSEMFDYDLGARPATFVVDGDDSSSAESEIAVAFSRDPAQSYGAQNAAPTVWARSVDVAGLTNKSKVIIDYGYLLAEDGSRIQTEDGEDIIAENEFTYRVKSYNADPFGVTVMELSLVSPLTT